MSNRFKKERKYRYILLIYLKVKTNKIVCFILSNISISCTIGPMFYKHKLHMSENSGGGYAVSYIGIFIKRCPYKSYKVTSTYWF